QYGYLLPWKSMQEAGFLAACLQQGIKVRVAERPFEYKGQRYEAGTLILLKTSNAGVANLEAKIRQLAEDNRVTLQAVETGFMDKGADFGSSDVKTIHAPRVVVATGDGTSSLSAGQVWHYFDRELKYPATLVNVRDLGSLAWHRYDVLVLPDGFNYGNLLGKEGALRTWVQQGGKVIALEGAVSAMARADWGLSAKKADSERGGIYDAVQLFGTREQESLKQNNPGSIYKVEIDNSHPLGFGFDKQYFTLKADDIAYEFLKDGWNVGVIKKDFQVAGFTGSKVKEKLKDGVLFGELPMGRGSVVFLTDDVLFRSFWESGKLMMANAVFMVNLGGYRY
ncbi:MAG: zinc carboxypeptidase, partial [Chitinophagaceae bacterium]|nr:zinc carboxypeptidase [Chitinophagaceae bacterium]